MLFMVGSTSLTGASSDSLPASTCCIAAVVVIALVIDAIQKIVSWVIAGPPGSARVPKAPE
jgi:hypothetical protein